MDEYTSEEVWPMEFPWTLRLLLKLRSWLVLKKDGSINRRMERLLHTTAPAVTTAGVAAADVVIDDKTRVWVRTFTPVLQHHLQLPVIFYFHGGGFTSFSANSRFSDFFGRYLCKTFSALVVSVDYRKTPGHPYPAAYDDCHAALRWVADGALANADLSRCLLVGESAGGNIVHHVACRAAVDPALAAGRLTVVGNVALFPFFGGEERTPAELRLVKAPMLNYRMCDVAWKWFLPDGATRDHPAANVCGAEAPEVGGIPLAPFLVTVGEYDCLKDWQVRYAQALQRAGKQVQLRFYRGGIHCFHVFPQVKSTRRLLADVEDFVHSRLLSPKPVM